MFDGFGYNHYRGGGMGFMPGVYSGYGNYGQGMSSAHGSIARGGSAAISVRRIAQNTSEKEVVIRSAINFVQFIFMAFHR